MIKERERKSLLKRTALFFIGVLPWLILAGVGYLWYSGELSPIIDFLDNKNYALKIVSPELTPYKIIKGICAVIFLFWFATIFSRKFNKYFSKFRRISSSNRSLVSKAVSIFAYFLAFIFSLDVMGIDLTALAVLSGAIGIGLGFGLQKITSNFISGLILLLEKSIIEGDLLELESGILGFVRMVGARHTLLETYDGKEVLIPNEEFITNRVTNCTHSNKIGRIQLRVGVSYKADINKAKEIMLKAAQKHSFKSILGEAEVFLEEFGDSSVNFKINVWLADISEGRFSLIDRMLFDIWNGFKENNIEIPFPQRDININQEIPVRVVESG